MSATPRGPRIGLFGGAFDPPHLAHVALARAALAQLGLAELRILPTGQAWHKTRSLTPAAHRLAMTRLAFEPVAGASVDAREIERDGPTYTVDTLRELHAEQPAAEWVLLMGADQARALERWHDWPSVVRLAVIAIADREGLCAPAPGELAWAREPGARIEYVRLPEMDISATGIRRQLASAPPDAPDSAPAPAPMVPPAVARYIAQHHLYRSQPDDL